MNVTGTLATLGIGLLTLACAAPSSAQPPDSPRAVISLNGSWEIAEGNLSSPPAAFPSTVPVPGLVDMAKPGFADVGTTRSGRQAFWYRRTFNIDRPLPHLATLKVLKASFGCQVYVNGKKHERSLSAFTPVLTEVRSDLRQGENELLICVGDHPEVLVPHKVAHGLEPEKIRFIPGIFDNVELILTGTPSIANVQVKPEIESRTAVVQALLSNDTGASTRTRVTCTVREHKSGRIVGTAETEVSLPATHDETTATVSVPIENCQLWSPENPFLYDVIVDCGTDHVTDRFGMRSFRLDQATGRPYLNGKPYYMRGSNITLYRFFEDESREGLPWDENWVRDLHRLVKGMNWNSLRYCIGFPPEFWYDIADEEGILIQDEFPIWNSRNRDIPNDLDTGILAGQFRDWMRDRWNHPCVVIWDAQNETHSTQTGVAISAVRHLDLSNRPWDNGYGRYRPAGDSYESHPYLFNKPHFELEDLAETSSVPKGNHGGPNENNNPVILNEYAWLWLNRDGTPTRLTQRVYARLFHGKKATPEKRRVMYARYLAALTEFWRSGRACAGILHFTILGYSRPQGGQTSDHFLNVRNLELEPNFVKYVRDSFAPVGIMIDFWKSRVTPGTRQELTVVLINDLADAWNGPVTLQLLKDGKPIEQLEKPAEVAPYGRTAIPFPVTFPVQEGDYQLLASYTDAAGEEISSLRDVSVTSTLRPDKPTTPGLAMGKPVTVSSVQDRKTLRPEFAVDNNMETRWAARPGAPQWLRIDLEEEKDVSAVDLRWENAFARAYHLETSTDGESWRMVHETKDSHGDEPMIRFAPHRARYLRLTATQPATRWGVSLWEIRVY